MRAKLKPVKNAEELLDMYYLDVRSALMETAAAFDRFERAEGGEVIFEDPRLKNLVDACRLLTEAKGTRVEQFQMLMSE